MVCVSYTNRWLQDVFDVPLVIMLTDDEKYMHSQKIDIDDVKRYTKLNAMDIIAVGFDIKKTFIFSDFDFIGGAFYENMCKMVCEQSNRFYPRALD